MSIMQTRIHRVFSLLFAVLLTFLLLPRTVFAAETTATISIDVVKEIKGDTPATAETFTFQLTAIDGSPMPEGSMNGVKTLTLQGRGTAAFGKIEYTALGDYQYTISEVKGSHMRYSYDPAKYLATVQVTWKKEVGGEKQALLYLVKQGEDAKQEKALFTNTYTHPQSVSIDPPIRKLIDGSPATAGTFTFRFTADNPAYPMPSGSSGGTKTLSITGAGSVEVGNITFTDPGVYTYTVREENGGLSGYTYDTTVYAMTVTVTEVGHKLQAVRTIKKADGTSASALNFTNIFKSGGSAAKPGGPKTGDEGNDALWWTFLGLATLGMTAVLLYRGKTKSDSLT